MEKVSGFTVLEYVRTSIEIIMNLKIEDLEKEFKNRNRFEKDSVDGGLSTISISSNNLIEQSMKDAINAMMETQESARSNYNDKSHVRGPPAKYEKLIQKLESDVRGHIKLEHEMKIHMDYLENKLEILQTQAQSWEQTEAKLKRKAETAQDKLQLVKESKDREIKDLSRKLAESQARLKESMQKASEFEK